MKISSTNGLDFPCSGDSSITEEQRNCNNQVQLSPVLKSDISCSQKYLLSDIHNSVSASSDVCDSCKLEFHSPETFCSPNASVCSVPQYSDQPNLRLNLNAKDTLSVLSRDDETHSNAAIQGTIDNSSIQIPAEKSTLANDSTTETHKELHGNPNIISAGDNSSSAVVPNLGNISSSKHTPVTSLISQQGAIPKSFREPHFCTKEYRSSSFDQTSSFVIDSTRNLVDKASSLTIDSSRKASLPLAVSEPEVSVSNPELWMISGPIRTFARCGRNSVPRITYSKLKDTHTISGGGEGRPIYPSLPFSPFCSPSSSPRLQRHQPKECRKVTYESHPDYEQLNHYRLKGEIGQVSTYFVVPIIYNYSRSMHCV